jgi:excisionase family DNA binding protein
MCKAVNVDELLCTPVEAAHALGMSRSTIYLLMESGDVPSVRIGASRRIPAEGLRRYVARLAAGANDQGPQAPGTRRTRETATAVGVKPHDAAGAFFGPQR